jgi:hypothetical protein
VEARHRLGAVAEGMGADPHRARMGLMKWVVGWLRTFPRIIARDLLGRKEPEGLSPAWDERMPNGKTSFGPNKR